MTDEQLKHLADQCMCHPASIDTIEQAGEAISDLIKQRDELLSAIEPLAELCDNLCRWDRRFDEALDVVDAAIASVKESK
jgi:hypothetical protein